MNKDDYDQFVRKILGEMDHQQYQEYQKLEKQFRYAEQVSLKLAEKFNNQKAVGTKDLIDAISFSLLQDAEIGKTALEVFEELRCFEAWKDLPFALERLGVDLRGKSTDKPNTLQDVMKSFPQIVHRAWLRILEHQGAIFVPLYRGKLPPGFQYPSSPCAMSEAMMLLHMDDYLKWNEQRIAILQEDYPSHKVMKKYEVQKLAAIQFGNRLFPLDQRAD